MLGSKPETKKALVDRILKSALDGDMTAAKMIWHYMDGTPKQTMDVTSENNKLPTMPTIVLNRCPHDCY
jgi:TRAP-type mannitol/chloroaromatic compound transport system substrate-binding protein